MDPFSYTGLPEDLVHIYSTFERKFSELFVASADAHGLGDCHFFISDSNNCNARATRDRGCNLISITNAYPVVLNRSFKSQFFRTLPLAGLVNQVSASDAYAEVLSDENFDIAAFMLECSVRFTFHHEFRHIQQFNSRAGQGRLEFNENLEEKPFDLRKHAWEFDADRIATFEVLKFAFQEKRRLGYAIDENFKVLLYLAASSLIITKNLFYFNVTRQIVGMGKIHAIPFYTKKCTHPHHLVRMIGVLNYFRDCANDDFPQLDIGLQELLTNVMAITSLYFKGFPVGFDIPGALSEDLGRHIDDVNAYNDQLYDAAVRDKAIRSLLDRAGVNVE